MSARVEELLEELVGQNREILDCLRDVVEKLDAIETAMSSASQELDWLQPHSSAKELIDKVGEIETAIRDLER